MMMLALETLNNIQPKLSLILGPMHSVTIALCTSGRENNINSFVKAFVSFFLFTLHYNILAIKEVQFD